MAARARRSSNPGSDVVARRHGEQAEVGAGAADAQPVAEAGLAALLEIKVADLNRVLGVGRGGEVPAGVAGVGREPELADVPRLRAGCRPPRRPSCPRPVEGREVRGRSAPTGGSPISSSTDELVPLLDPEPVEVGIADGGERARDLTGQVDRLGRAPVVVRLAFEDDGVGGQAVEEEGDLSRPRASSSQPVDQAVERRLRGAEGLAAAEPVGPGGLSRGLELAGDGLQGSTLGVGNPGARRSRRGGCGRGA